MLAGGLEAGGVGQVVVVGAGKVFGRVCNAFFERFFFFGAALNEKFKPIKPPAETERCVCVTMCVKGEELHSCRHGDH